VAVLKDNKVIIGVVAIVIVAAAVYMLWRPGEDQSEIEKTPLEQIDLLLTSAGSQQDLAAKKIDLLEALELSIENELTDKTEEVEGLLSEVSRMQSKKHRTEGDYGSALDASSEAVHYSKDNAWAYVEGIISSHESGRPSGDFCTGLKGVENVEAFSLESDTMDEYSGFVVDLNNEATAEDDLDARVLLLENAMAVAGALEAAGADLPMDTISHNLASAYNSQVVRFTAMGSFSDAETAAGNAVDVMTTHSLPSESQSTICANVATMYALSENLESAIEYGEMAVELHEENPGAYNVLAACLASQGGQENVESSFTYIQQAVALSPENELYMANLEVIEEAVTAEQYEGIAVDYGVAVSPEGVDPETLDLRVMKWFRNDKGDLMGVVLSGRGITVVVVDKDGNRVEGADVLAWDTSDPVDNRDSDTTDENGNASCDLDGSPNSVGVHVQWQDSGGEWHVICGTITAVAV
jgi:tetratricopeptide (TPR) repeat protein